MMNPNARRRQRVRRLDVACHGAGVLIGLRMAIRIMEDGGDVEMLRALLDVLRDCEEAAANGN